LVPGGWEGHTQDEIAEAVNMTQQAIDKRLKELQLLENFPKVVKLSALYDGGSLVIFTISEFLLKLSICCDFL
jgi:hypothetical protein